MKSWHRTALVIGIATIALVIWTVLEMNKESATLSADTLRGLPGVADVKSAPSSSSRPVRQIIHLLDWEHVSRERLAIDFETAMGRPLTDEDYNEYLKNLEAVQRDHLAILEALARDHGLKIVLVERLTEVDMPGLPARLNGLREARSIQDELVRKLAEVQIQLNHATPGEWRHKLLAVEREILNTQTTYRRDKLKAGAAFESLLAGRIEAVLPLDDSARLDAAKPKAGATKADATANFEREQAMVHNASKTGPVVVIICSGSHDLMPAIRKIGQPCEYTRVAGPAYQKLAKPEK
jgi:hypothetical protein